MTRSASEVISHHGRCSPDFRNVDNYFNIWRTQAVSASHTERRYSSTEAASLLQRRDPTIVEKKQLEVFLFTPTAERHWWQPFSPGHDHSLLPFRKISAHSGGNAEGEQCSCNVAQAAASKSLQQMTEIICRFAKKPRHESWMFQCVQLKLNVKKIEETRRGLFFNDAACVV